MPIFTPERTKPCPSCGGQVSAKVEKSFMLFSAVDDTATCKACKKVLLWNQSAFFKQDLGAVFFILAIVVIKLKMLAALFAMLGLVLFFWGEATMEFIDPDGKDNDLERTE